MRRLTTLLPIAALAVAGCIGQIGDRDRGGHDGLDGPGSHPNGDFTCDPTVLPLTPSAIKRLPKIYFQNAVDEFFSTLDQASRDALVALIQSRLDLVPNDVSDHYSTNDDNVAQDHVDAVFGVAVALASKLGDESYVDQLLSVCGAGSTKASLEDDACLTKFVTYYGRKALRRPASQAEIDDFKSFYHQTTSAGVDGLGMLVGRFIAHPGFYYRFDDEGTLATGAEGKDAVHVLTKWELLSKVTFLFWAAPPTDELLDRVEDTDITEDAALGDLVDDVLADPKAERGILRFYREWLLLDKAKMPATEGNVNAGQAMIAAAGLDGLPSTHREDMIQEVLDLTKHYTLSTDGKLTDILTSQYSFARTPALATIYGVDPWDGTPDHLVPLPAGERSGLFTRAALVASGAEYTRPVIKGKLIRTRLLCTPINPPPPNLDIKPLTHPPDKTTRQSVDETTAAATCQACHSQMNTLGYLTENYDPLGRFRTKELRFADNTGDIVSELDIDTSGIANLSDKDTTKLGSALELGAHVAETGLADGCMVRNYFEFMSGREPDPTADGCAVEKMKGELSAEGGSIKSMLRASVLQESFRKRLVE